MASIINLNPGNSKSFSFHNGHVLTTAQINSTTSSGANTVDITDLTVDGLSLSWDGADVFDPTAPIIGSTCVLSLLIDHNDELNLVRDFLAGGEADTYLSLVTNQGAKWYGNLLPEEARIDVTDGITEVQLRFGDGLGLLKDIDFKASDGRPYSDGTTAVTASGNLLKWAWLALENIPWMQEGIVNANIIRETPVLEPTDGTQEGLHGTFLSDAFTPVKSFEQNRSVEIRERDRRDLPRANTFTSAYDVLVDICQTSGYRLTWNMTGWHFFSPLSATSDNSLTSQESYVWSTSDFATIATGSQGYDTATGKTSNAFAPAYDLDAAYALSSSSSTWSIPVGSVYATHLEVGSGNVAANAAGFNASYANSTTWDIFEAERNTFQDATMEIVDAAPMRLRMHAFAHAFNYKENSNWKPRAGLKPCLVARVTVGSEGGTAHYLKGDVKEAPETTTLKGGLAFGADVDGKAWDVFDDATWTTSSDDLLYIPFNSFTHSNPTPEEISYLNAAGDTIYNFPMPFNAKLKGGDDNVIEEDGNYDTGEIDWTRTFDAPTGQGNFTGLKIEIGLAVFDWTGDELYNSLDFSRTTLQSSNEDLRKAFDQDELKNVIREFKLYACELGLGGTREDDRTYFAEGGRGSIPLQAIETRIATRNGALWGGAPSTLNFRMADQSFDSECDVRILWDTDISSESNIDLLIGEYLRLLEGSSEGVETTLIPKFDSVTDFLTPDRYAVTDCLTDNTHVQPTEITINSTSGAIMSGYVVDRRGSVSIVVKPDVIDVPGGRPPVSSVNPGASGTENFLGKTLGGSYAANVEVATQLALLDDGLLDLSSALGDTGTIVDGAYNGIQFDQSGAANGNALVYNNGTWEPGTVSGGTGGAFTSAFQPTRSVGNIPAGVSIPSGTTFEDYLVDMVVSYQAPAATLSSWNTSAKEHGSSYSDTNFTLTFSNVSNLSATTGTASFTDTYNTNVTETGITASTGTKNITLAASQNSLVTNASTAGIDGTARSRSNCNKLTVSGFVNSNGASVSSVNKTHTTYFRSKMLRSAVNYAAGIGSNLGGMFGNPAGTASSYSVLSTTPFSSYPGSSNTTGNVGALDYVYIAVPECIFTNMGGTTSGMGTVTVVTETAFGDVAVAVVYCGTQDYEAIAGYGVRYVVIRCGQPGELQSKLVKFG